MKFSIEAVGDKISVTIDSDEAVLVNTPEPPAHHVTQTIFEDRMRELCEMVGCLADHAEWPDVLAALRQRTLSFEQFVRLQNIANLAPRSPFFPLEEMVSRLEHLAPPHPTVAMLEKRIGQITGALGMPAFPGGHTIDAILTRIENLKKHGEYLEDIRHALSLPGTIDGDIAKVKAIGKLVGAAIVLNHEGPTAATLTAANARSKFFTAVLDYLHVKP